MIPVTSIHLLWIRFLPFIQMENLSSGGYQYNLSSIPLIVLSLRYCLLRYYGPIKFWSTSCFLPFSTLSNPIFLRQILPSQLVPSSYYIIFGYNNSSDPPLTLFSALCHTWIHTCHIDSLVSLNFSTLLYYHSLCFSKYYPHPVPDGGVMVLHRHYSVSVKVNSTLEEYTVVEENGQTYTPHFFDCVLSAEDLPKDPPILSTN